jgi:Bardet-Biedl syndrome 4 protein
MHAHHTHLPYFPSDSPSSFNLGLAHLNTGQYASAFHHLSASVNLKPDFAASYAHMAVVLSRLDDFENACAAYEKAIATETDFMFELNYTITLMKHGKRKKARRHWTEFK